MLNSRTIYHKNYRYGVDLFFLNVKMQAVKFYLVVLSISSPVCNAFSVKKGNFCNIVQSNVSRVNKERCLNYVPEFLMNVYVLFIDVRKNDFLKGAL